MTLLLFLPLQMVAGKAGAVKVCTKLCSAAASQKAWAHRGFSSLECGSGYIQPGLGPVELCSRRV